MAKAQGTIPRGPPEWGEMLWQEPWADEGRSGQRDYRIKVVGYLFLILTSGVAIVFGLVTGGPLEEYWMFYLTLPLFLWGLWVATIRYRNILPNRIYERGFTFYPGILMWNGRREEDFFHPFNAVARITVQRPKYKASGLFETIVESEDGTTVSRIHSIDDRRKMPIFLGLIRKRSPEIQFEGIDLVMEYQDKRSAVQGK